MTCGMPLRASPGAVSSVVRSDTRDADSIVLDGGRTPRSSAAAPAKAGPPQAAVARDGTAAHNRTQGSAGAGSRRKHGGSGASRRRQARRAPSAEQADGTAGQADSACGAVAGQAAAVVEFERASVPGKALIDSVIGRSLIRDNSWPLFTRCE